ncbi:LysR family transcriptional regulator [Streptomyces sp. 891-h]|uniref:LysR family transcriptional regulator n=1 Tax=Streptomyces sp. 891-h TaxID=2720714 RepID=UPI001FA95CB3|nr:LysR family transcriptional regulator [Streptomyces sp. 891-h]UNZ16120.1 LysR family transcriptional regulator [Streptomyces sp. 891-h]
MDLLPLRYFQLVARYEHVGKAAAELRVAQPSVSRTIARLESELGVPLFDRQGKRIRLNRFGAAYLRRVDRALAELDDGRRELADAAGLEYGSVAIAVETMLTLTELLPDYRARYPEVDVRLFQATADGMQRQLQRGEVDLCIASQPLAGPSLRAVELLREEVLLAVPPAHRLADRETVTLAELEGEPFITTRTGHWQRALADRLFTEAGLRLTVVCEGDEPGATGDLIGAGLGVGLVPAMSRETTTRSSPVVHLRLDAPGCYRSLSLVWRQDAYLSVAAQRFSELAVAHFRRFASYEGAGRAGTS